MIATRIHPTILGMSPCEHDLPVLPELAGRARQAAATNRLLAARMRFSRDTDRLERRLQQLVERRKALRTGLREAPDPGGTPEREPLQFTCVDATRWSAEEMQEVVRLTSLQSLDSSSEVMRAVLFSRAENDHLLLLMLDPPGID